MVEESKLTLEIGCGDRRDCVDSIGIDIRRTASVDVLADARRLPFADESFFKVYSSHALEHLPHREVENALSEWIRVLKSRGTIEIKVPDLRARALLFALKPTWENVSRIYGEQDYEGNYHRSGFSKGMLKTILGRCGIERIHRRYSGYKGIPFVPSCLHLVGQKKAGRTTHAGIRSEKEAE